MHWNVSGIQYWQHPADLLKALPGRCPVSCTQCCGVISCSHSRHLFHQSDFLLFGPFSQLWLTSFCQTFVQLYQGTWTLWCSQGHHQISRLWECTDLQGFQNLIPWMSHSVSGFPIEGALLEEELPAPLDLNYFPHSLLFGNQYNFHGYLLPFVLADHVAADWMTNSQDWHLDW